MDPLTLLILGGLALAIYSTLVYRTVRDWLATQRDLGRFAELIKEPLANGNFKVIGNVFGN